MPSNSRFDALKRAVWTFIETFAAAFLVLAIGALSSPNFEEAKAAVIAGLAGVIAAALAAAKNVLFPPGHPAR
jgi:hypothetical protein